MTRPTCWDNPEEVILAELEPGESLLWAGRPRQGLFIRAGEFRAYFTGLLFFGFIIFTLIPGAFNGNQPNLGLIGLPHLVFGASLLFGRPIYDIWIRSRLAYGVTTQRVLFVSGLFRRCTKSWELDTLTDARLTPGWRGSGVIRFGCDAGREDLDRLKSMIFYSSLGLTEFELASEAEHVYRLIEQRLSKRARRQSRIPREIQSETIPETAQSSWEHPDEVVQTALAPGELLLWSGRPRLGFVPRWFEITGILMAFIWMQIFFLGPGGPAGRQFGMIILWALLAFKGLHVFVHVARGLTDAWMRARTAYAVTTTRVMILTGGAAGRIACSSLSLSRLAEISLTERGEAGGVVLVGPDLPVRPDQRALLLRAGATPLGMLRLELDNDALLVYRLIRRSRRPVEATG